MIAKEIKNNIWKGVISWYSFMSNRQRHRCRDKIKQHEYDPGEEFFDLTGVRDPGAPAVPTPFGSGVAIGVKGGGPAFFGDPGGLKG